MLAVKRSARVTLEMNPWNPFLAGKEARKQWTHPGLLKPRIDITRSRHHQKSNTGIPAGLMSLNLILKYIIYQGESDDSAERPSGLFRDQIPVCTAERKRLFIWKTMSHSKSEKLHGQCNTLLGKVISLFGFFFN